MNFRFDGPSPGLVVLWVFVCILISLVPAIIAGTLCQKLAAKKGYFGYFWTGFFLGIMGLLYVGFMPEIRRQAQDPRMMNNQMNNQMNHQMNQHR